MALGKPCSIQLSYGNIIFRVPTEGIEPSRPYERLLLKQLCLPNSTTSALIQVAAPQQLTLTAVQAAGPGAQGRNRTAYAQIFSLPLYQMSYLGVTRLQGDGNPGTP